MNNACLTGILAVLPQAQYRDLYIVISIILLCVFAISRVTFPKLFAESISLSKLFGFRVKEDLGATIRPFSTEHIYFTALFSFNLSFVVIFMANQFLSHIDALQLLQVRGFGVGLLMWLISGIVINLVVYAKYALINMAGWLFHTRPLVSRHFTDYVNASSLFYIIVTVCLSISTYSTFLVDTVFSQIVLTMVLLFIFYRTFLLYIKLLQLSPYSKLYIFSYICTTELIPLLIGLKFLTI